MKKTSLQDFKKVKKVFSFVNFTPEIRIKKSKEWERAVKYIKHHNQAESKALTWAKV